MNGHSELHYVDLIATQAPYEGFDPVPDAFHRVHVFNQEHNNVLGIDLPGCGTGFQQGTHPIDLGDRLRVFGPLADLTAFLDDARTRRFLSKGMAAKGALPVPQTHQMVTWRRDTPTDKMKPATWRRRAKRALARGAAPELAKAPLESGRPREQGAVFLVPVCSTSTGQQFVMPLRRDIVEKSRVDSGGAPIFNGYGLVLSGFLPLF